ncbi:hypothetical protein ACVIJ6_000568 [Bradyrhizobium sp. USDA 4369]
MQPVAVLPHDGHLVRLCARLPCAFLDCCAAAASFQTIASTQFPPAPETDAWHCASVEKHPFTAESFAQYSAACAQETLISNAPVAQSVGTAILKIDFIS